MRWLFNLGYLITAAIVVGFGTVCAFVLSALMSALGFITMVGGAIAVTAVLIREWCEGGKRDKR